MAMVLFVYISKLKLKKLTECKISHSDLPINATNTIDSINCPALSMQLVCEQRATPGRSYRHTQ